MGPKSKWTTETTFSFVPLPKENEEAYWAAIHYFAEVILKDVNDDMPICLECETYLHLAEDGQHICRNGGDKKNDE